MSWTFAAAVAIGGAIGAPLRLLIDSRITRATTRFERGTFPWGLLTVNALGSILIGIAYASVDGTWRALVVTGACGALTTYSSYALFIHRTWHEDRAVAWQALIAMPVVCITLCAVAVAATRALVG